MAQPPNAPIVGQPGAKGNTVRPTVPVPPQGSGLAGTTSNGGQGNGLAVPTTKGSQGNVLAGPTTKGVQGNGLAGPTTDGNQGNGLAGPATNSNEGRPQLNYTTLPREQNYTTLPSEQPNYETLPPDSARRPLPTPPVATRRPLPTLPGAKQADTDPAVATSSAASDVPDLINFKPQTGQIGKLPADPTQQDQINFKPQNGQIGKLPLDPAQQDQINFKPQTGQIGKLPSDPAQQDQINFKPQTGQIGKLPADPAQQDQIKFKPQNGQVQKLPPPRSQKINYGELPTVEDSRAGQTGYAPEAQRAGVVPENPLSRVIAPQKGIEAKPPVALPRPTPVAKRTPERVIQDMVKGGRIRPVRDSTGKEFFIDEAGFLVTPNTSTMQLPRLETTARFPPWSLPRPN